MDLNERKPEYKMSNIRDYNLLISALKVNHLMVNEQMEKAHKWAEEQETERKKSKPISLSKCMSTKCFISNILSHLLVMLLFSTR